MFERIQAKANSSAASPVQRAQPFFTPLATKGNKADETGLIQRDGPNETGQSEAGESDSEGPNALTGGAGVVWSQLNANNPRFSLFMDQQKEIWKNRLWSSQPTEYKVALVSWGLINLGMVGGVFAADERFRSNMIDLLQDTNLLAPLGIIPYAEYFPINSFQYTLPGDDGLYRFQFGFSLTPYLNLLRSAVPGMPETTLSGSLATSAGNGDFQVTGGNVSLGTLGGALRLSGGTSRGLPMLPTLMDNNDPYSLPVQSVQSIPGMPNPYANVQDIRFTLSLDLARLFPNVLGGGPRVQPKLKLGSPDDPMEREADRVAEQVIQRKCATCEKEEEKNVQRKSIGEGGLSPESEQAILQAKGGGQALEPGIQREMEQGIGHDFSRVTIHTDQRSADLNRKLNAKAFTHGSDVFFGEGQFFPKSKAGKRLLAHELTHVVQQGADDGRIQREFAVAPTHPDAVVDPLTEAEIQSAIRYNEARFRDISEIRLIRDVMGLAETPVQFTEDLITALAQYQAEYGLDDHDGKIGSDTAAVLAREFRAEGLRREGRQMRIRTRGVETVRNVDSGGRTDIFDAILDHEKARLLLQMKIKFNFTGAWPSNARKRSWQRDFIRQVQRQWNERYGLVPSGRHANRDRYLPYYRARVNPIAVASGEHYVANVAWATTQQTSSVATGSNTATLDSLDTNWRSFTAGGRTFRQRPGAHEFGHMLGLEHVNHVACTAAGHGPNHDMCYGGNDPILNRDIMGSGTGVRRDHYQPFLDAMQAITGFAWRATRRQRVP